RMVTMLPNETDIGSAISQGSGTFGNAGLNGNFVFKSQSAATGAGSFAAAGQLAADGNGNVTSGFAGVDEGGSVTSAAFTGNVSLNNGGYGSLTVNGGGTQHVTSLGVYMVDPTINVLDPNSTTGGGGALILTLSPQDVGSGVLLPQSGTAAVTGNFGVTYKSFTAAGGELNLGGQASIAGGGALTGTADANSLGGGAANLGVNLSGTLTADAAHAGRFTLPLTVAIGAAPPALTFAVYEASGGQLLWVETDTASYATGSLEVQQ